MLNKGQKVLVNGRINTRSYEAQDGTKRYVTEVVADFIGGYLSNQSQTETSSFTDEFGGAAADDSYPF